GADSGTALTVKNAVEALTEKDIQVLVAEPEKPKGLDKWDFNDALLFQGTEKIKSDLASASVFSPLPLNVIEHIKQMPLNDLLKHYVEMELHQSQLNPKDALIHNHLIKS